MCRGAMNSMTGADALKRRKDHRWRSKILNHWRWALESLRARVQGTPPLALVLGTLWARVQYTPPLALPMRSPLARVRCTPPLALELLGASLVEPSQRDYTSRFVRWQS